MIVFSKLMILVIDFALIQVELFIIVEFYSFDYIVNLHFVFRWASEEFPTNSS